MLDPSNRVVKSLWVGRRLNSTEQLCIHSFLANGHEFELFTYGPVAGVPRGTIIRDGNEIVPEKHIRQNTCEGFGRGSYTFFANYFRYTMLHQEGGWWVDMDTICIRPFDLQETDIVATSHEGTWGDLANNNVMKFSPANPITQWCAEKHWEKMMDGDLPFAYGPKTLQAALKVYPGRAKEAPVHCFNPISWRHVIYLTRPVEPLWSGVGLRRLLGRRERVGRVTKETYSVHLWNECWSQLKLERDATHHPKSVVERLKRRYLPKGEREVVSEELLHL